MALLALTVISSGCGHIYPPAQIAREEWCGRVESFKENDHWQCTWPPSRYASGDFGPASNLSRYNLVGAVLDAKDPSVAANTEVRKIGTLDLSYSKEVQIDSKSGLSLRSLSPWLPDATIASDKDTKASISFRLEDAEWRLFKNLAPVIATGLLAKAQDESRQAALTRGRDAICQPGTSLVEGVLVGKIAATIQSAETSHKRGELGWKSVGVSAKVDKSESQGLTIKSSDEQVAILYLVNPAEEVLKSFKVCALAARAPAPECGDEGEVCCANSHCSRDLMCQSGRCFSAPSLCGDSQQVCCGGNSCKQGLTCDKGQCIELGQHFDRGMAMFALYRYDDAISEFEAGFLEQPSPEYLYNIAVAQQLANHREQAIQYYQRYLEVAPAAANREQVLTQLRALGAPMAKPKPKPTKLQSDLPDDLAAPDLGGAAPPPPKAEAAPPKTPAVTTGALPPVGDGLAAPSLSPK